jgi:hypothetical protein
VKHAAQTRVAIRVLGRRALLCAAVLLLSAPYLVQAETPPALAKFAGTFKYPDKDKGIAIVDKAIDDGLSDVNMVQRFIIKKYLAAHFADVIVIQTPSGKVGIKTGELPMAMTELGKSDTFKSEDGKYTIKVTHNFDGTKLTEVSEGENGKTVTVYEILGNGKTLRRNVTFTSDRQKKPVKYKLDYARK